VAALTTAQTQKPMREDAAFQKRIELVFAKLRQTRPGLRFDRSQEAL